MLKIAYANIAVSAEKSSNDTAIVAVVYVKSASCFPLAGNVGLEANRAASFLELEHAIVVIHRYTVGAFHLAAKVSAVLIRAHTVGSHVRGVLARRPGVALSTCFVLAVHALRRLAVKAAALSMESRKGLDRATGLAELFVGYPFHGLYPLTSTVSVS